MKKLIGNVVLVTGASKGIGALAERGAERGSFSNNARARSLMVVEFAARLS
ncbi:MAG TPA: hypothetical protein VEL06_06435 [Haliangiales bacterium]|nr:hypothetical protein [Haliangiales bacterium]